MNIADLDFLTPRSVFTRADGRESRFLFLTNTALPKKVQAEYPPQVVYADENNNILSCDIERFLNKRQFHMVDPELEARLVNLLAISSSGNEDALDLDGDDDALTIEDTDELPPIEAGEAAANAVGDDFLSGETGEAVPLVKFVPSSDHSAAIDADYLAQAVSSYQQSPGTAPRSVQHALFIRAEAGITRESLISAFSPASIGARSIFTFEVEIEGETVHVNWHEFLGVYPCVFYGSSMYQVLFNTFADDIVAAAAEVKAAETAMPVVNLAPIDPAPVEVEVSPAEAMPNAPTPVVQVQVAAQ